MRIRSVILAFSMAICFLAGCGKGPRPDTVLENPDTTNDTLLKNTALYFQFFGTPSEQIQSLCRLGQHYVEKREYDEALKVYRLAEKIPAGKVTEAELTQLHNQEMSLLQYLPEPQETFRPQSPWFKKTIITLLILQFFTILVMSSQFRKQKKQEAQLQALYDDLRAEYDQVRNLPFMLSGLPPASRETVEKKMRALGAFFTDSAPKSLDVVADQLDSLAQNRKDLLETIGMLYATYHPAFVSHLLEKNLTTLEVGYCCLLVMGLRTGEMRDVINRSGVYNINVAIRRKLEIDTNASTLSSCLKKMYASLEG